MAIGTFLVALDMMWLLANMPDSPVAELINTLPNAIGLVFGIVLLPGDVVPAAELKMRRGWRLEGTQTWSEGCVLPVLADLGHGPKEPNPLPLSV